MPPTTKRHEYETQREGTTAYWSVRGGVILVHEIRRADGTRTQLEPPRELGQALPEMPRPLWDDVRSSYERKRGRRW